MRLVLNEERKKRAAQNRRFAQAFREGARVKAIYEDAENDPAVSCFVYVHVCLLFACVPVFWVLLLCGDGGGGGGDG
jgi:hypothetical protein